MGEAYAGRAGWQVQPGRPFAIAGRAGAAMMRIRAYDDASDADLMMWSAEGDRRAFDEVVSRHGSFALRVAARIVRDASTAEDIVQDAMVKAWNQAERYDPARAKLTTWLYRIVVNLCIDHRRRTRLDPLPADYDAVDPSAGAQDMLETAERRIALAQALSNLPAHHRAAMALVYEEGMSGAETARIMGKSAKAVERLLARALHVLRNQLSTQA